MFRKVLVANRGEIAIRAFRAAYELGAGTVAVFPHEDRNSLHRLKADEAYQIGEPGHPVRAYLSVDEIVTAARKAGADAVYPGYGFLSENPELAARLRGGGHHVRRPAAEVLELTGNKARAIAAAREAGLPVLESSAPSADRWTSCSPPPRRSASRCSSRPSPVAAAAACAGSSEPPTLRESLEAAMREAESAFGDATVFLEQAVVEPRHIEVQILADGEGNVIHLFERDCSVQRRHQKVIEIAPAPNLAPELRDRICADAVAFARHIGYRNAGTVEFLLDPQGHYVFIEMNPRIQVEHTVTEEVTDVDLVQSQMRIASGETLDDLGLSQETVQLRGAALQCRITTEDPANGFRPDTGTISAYRSPGGSGIRLDGGTAGAGTAISAHFDSMLVKLTCRGRDLRARRRPCAPCDRGVPHPRCLHEHPVPAGRAGRPGLLRGPRHHVVHREAPPPADGAPLGRPRHAAADLPGGRHGQPAERRPARPTVDPREKLPVVDLNAEPPAGLQAEAGRARPGGLRAVDARAARPSASRTRRSATRTSRCSPPECAPRTCSPSRRTSRA